MQTKKQSAFESVINIVIGLITSFLIQLIIYPLLEIPVSFTILGVMGDIRCLSSYFDIELGDLSQHLSF